MGNTSILLATTNPAKQRKLRWLLDGLPLDPTTLEELGLAGEAPREEEHSHEEIARLKAQSWSRASGMLAISSDGGLVIPSLGQRWDSLLTNRFAGEGATEGARLERLLQLMRPYKGEERRASWLEALAIAEEGRSLGSWTVIGPTGVLLEEPDGGAVVPGFWVFAVWYFPEMRKTYNELDDQELESLNDHWGQLKDVVQRFFREGIRARR